MTIWNKWQRLTLLSVLHHPLGINLLNVLDDDFEVVAVLVRLFDLDGSPGEVDDVADGMTRVVLLAAVNKQKQTQLRERLTTWLESG